jgi:phospholipid-binding lipoprotein MlaA
MKLQVLALVALVIATAGCAVSDKPACPEYPANKNTLAKDGTAGRTRNSSLTTELSANKDDIVDANEEAADDDFDLLEEEFAEQMVEVADPLEGLNRIMFGINDILYFWVAKPVTQVYEGVVPAPVRIGVGNFFHNLTTPIRFVNCHLQGKVDAADIELKRFLINTTSGILGFGDPARDKMGLEPVEEDLGQTLAVHGFGNGFYMVLPLLGPSTLRDAVGFVGDQFLNPVRYVEPWEVSIGISGTKAVNEGSFHIGEYETFKSSAVDPYVAMRQAYIQYRAKQIKE